MRRFLFLACFLGCSLSGSASHLLDGEISYRYIGDSTGIVHHYEITLRLYRDISGVDQMDSMFVDISSSCYPEMREQLSFRPFRGENTDGSGGLLLSSRENCMDTTIMALQKSLYLFRTKVILPGRCEDWKFGVNAGCCRARDITNLNDLGDIYIYVTLNNSVEGHVNSSIPNNPLAHATHIQAQASKILQVFGNDPDGDSTYIEFAHCLHGPDPEVDTVPFANGHSVQQPFLTENGIEIDQENRALRFKSEFSQQIPSIAIRISEYRYNNQTQDYYLIGQKHTEFVPLMDNLDPSAGWAINLLLDTTISCLDQWVHIDTRFGFQSSSLVPSDFEVMGNDSVIYPIIEATSDNPGGVATKIHLKLSEPLNSTDTLQIFSRTGSDGNFLITRCNYEVADSGYVNSGEPFPNWENIIIDSCFVSLEENDIPDFKIYPNPVQDILHLEMEKSQEESLRVQILNYTGQLVREEVLDSDPEQAMMPVNVSSLSPGVYFLRVGKTKQNAYFKRFVKY